MPDEMTPRRFPRPWDIEKSTRLPSFFVTTTARRSPTFISRMSPAGARQQNCSRATKHGASLPTLPGGLSCCVLSSRTQMRWCKGNDGRENTSRSQLD
jgi:hypothetical protein